MGVPSFYRWISLRYPHCVTSIRQAQPGNVPEEEQNYDEDEEPVDNLYIDMNGIIHPCFHPEDGPQPETEDEVFALIIKKVESLIAVAKPRKVLYLAIDGPAPRAKMNQQRARRFRAAQEAEQKRRIEAELRERYAAAGRPLPPAQPPLMDSNVITPGTEFMALLGRWLRHWAYVKLNETTSPPPYRIVLSDASVPGEGEHKAMAFIRAQRHAPGYDPNTRHMIHGLDADLIMLALATHEPHL